MSVATIEPNKLHASTLVLGFSHKLLPQTHVIGQVEKKKKV